MICPNCHNDIEKQTKFCPECGYDFAKKKCPVKCSPNKKWYIIGAIAFVGSSLAYVGETTIKNHLNTLCHIGCWAIW